MERTRARFMRATCFSGTSSIFRKITGRNLAGNSLERVIKGQSRMASLQIIDSIPILAWSELISYNFRHFAVQSRGLSSVYGYRGIETTLDKRGRPDRRLFVISIKTDPMHMDEPIARNDVNAADSTGFKASAVFGRRVSLSLKSSSCCDIFMTRIFSEKKVYKIRRSSLPLRLLSLCFYACV